MQTQCTLPLATFQRHGRRRVEAAFDGGHLSSDGGVLLLREVDERLRLTERMAACFRDLRAQSSVEFSVREMLAQRTFGIALGYEDLQDHDRLRVDRALALGVGRRDIEGRDRREKRDRGKPLCGKSTLNRLELSAEPSTRNARYHRILSDFDALDDLLVALFIERHSCPPEQIILDLDATDVPIHGAQEQRFFHGYYGHYCYLPLYIVAGDFPLCVRLRSAGQDAAEGCIEELAPIVERLRSAWPGVRLIVRGDSGFCREPVLRWCEDEGLDYVIGLARNQRLQARIAKAAERSRRRCLRTGRPSRRFKNLRYRTQKTWSRSRRVVAKAEHLPGKANARFVVTSMARTEVPARELYEKWYCARGDMENRIKEHQLELFGHRMSTQVVRSNQLRLYFSTFAYILFAELKRLALATTPLATAQPKTIRQKLLKIAARITVSVRRIRFAFASACPYAELFHHAAAQLARAGP